MCLGLCSQIEEFKVKFKKGLRFKSKESHVTIELICRQKSNYWMTKKITGLGKAHRVAEDTLNYSYEVVNE